MISGLGVMFDVFGWSRTHLIIGLFQLIPILFITFLTETSRIDKVVKSDATKQFIDVYRQRPVFALLLFSSTVWIVIKAGLSNKYISQKITCL